MSTAILSESLLILALGWGGNFVVMIILYLVSMGLMRLFPADKDARYAIRYPFRNLFAGRGAPPPVRGGPAAISFVACARPYGRAVPATTFPAAGCSRVAGRGLLPPSGDRSGRPADEAARPVGCGAGGRCSTSRTRIERGVRPRCI